MRFGIAAQDDVGTTAGHVGGDRDGAHAAGLGDDFRFALVLLGVEHFVLDAAAFEHARQPFTLFDRDGTDQHRPALALDRGDLRLGEWSALSLRSLRLKRRLVVVSSLTIVPHSSSPFFQTSDVPLVEPFDFVGNRVVLFFLRAVDHVGVLEPLHRRDWSESPTTSSS